MIELPDLPYSKDALEPVISSKTLEFHYGKHHKKYVETANQLIEGTGLKGKPLEEIVKAAAADPAKTALFNNAAQVWNHNFYWNCLRPSGGGEPTGEVATKIKATWGSTEKFAEELKNAGMSQFGSGYAWLVLDGGELRITKTPNADNPLVHGMKPLLGIDVWEHAYYLDYQNLRAEYLSALIGKLINWDFVNSCLKS
ncbi:MAG: superoxide dismutase [Desulfomonilia bacterium]|jgi:Fe-Mn family superoxide dismutase